MFFVTRQRRSSTQTYNQTLFVPRILSDFSLTDSTMKRCIPFLLLAIFSGLAGNKVSAQSSAPPSGPSTTDDVVSSISGIKRPTPTPAAANTGPKRGVQATLTTDPKGETPMTSFSSTTPKIYLRWTDDSAVKGHNLRIVWYSAAKNKKLSEDSKTLPGPNSFGEAFLIQPSGGFPPGKYRVSLYEDNKLSKSVLFTVTK